MGFTLIVTIPSIHEAIERRCIIRLLENYGDPYANFAAAQHLSPICTFTKFA